MLTNDPGVRLGADPEAVHHARVATRRARALLRAAGTLVDPAWADALRAELAWLGKLLGPVRDLDVLIGHVAEEAAALERADARAIGTIRSRARPATRSGAPGTPGGDVRAALLPPPRHPRGRRSTPLRGPGTASLEEIAADAFKRARKAMKALPQDPTDDELHAVRIETKRARYAAELAEPVLGKAGARFLRRAKVVQDVIGEHQDAFVAEARIRELAVSGGASAALAAGRLIERQGARKQAAREELPAAWRALREGRPGRVLMKDGVVRAAGGAVVREGDGSPEVVIVHRPKYDDWTLPKGKTEPGESDEECALREVEEETGLRCELLEELESSSYSDASGRPKVARYWLMRPVGGRLRPTREVDDARWVPLRDAEAELSYDRDVRVLRSIGRG